MKCIAIVVVAMFGATAFADDDLATQGEALAKAGDYSRAIDTFKAADKQRPSTRNACMIGLAYLRREAWPQAELFLATCKERATATDPAPDWLPAAEHQLEEKLAAASVAAVDVAVKQQVAAQITVSSFALDESFSPPRTLHLALGRHTFQVIAPGYPSTEKTITIADRSPQHVTIDLTPPFVAPVVPEARPASPVPYVVMGAGAGIGIGALIYGLVVVKPIRDNVADASTMDAYNAEKDRFTLRRDLAYVAGGAAVAAIAVGAILRFTVYAREDVRVGVAPTTGGGLVTFELTR